MYPYTQIKFKDIKDLGLFRPVFIGMQGSDIFLKIKKDGQAHYLHITDFKPYFYVPKPTHAKEMKHFSEFLPISYCTRIEVNHPAEVKQEREKYPYTYEADILYDIRFGVDLNINYSDQINPTEKIRIWYFDIEVFRDNHGEPSWENPTHFINSISIYDNFTDKIYMIIVNKDNQKINPFSDRTEIIETRSERELLEEFIKLYHEHQPDIMTGWYVIGFDIVYLCKTLYTRYPELYEKFTLLEGLPPIERRFFDEGIDVETFFIYGTTILDYRALYMRYSREKQEQYSLNYIADVELGKGKVEYEGSLDNLYKTDINKFIEYNIIDTLLVKELDDKLAFIDFVLSLSELGGLPLHYFNFKITSKIIESLIMKYIRTRFDDPLVMRTKPKNLDTSKYKGAYVKKPKAGIYKWIADLDASSLYPSIVDALNISPETYICRVLIDQELINDFRSYMFGFGENTSINDDTLLTVKFRTTTRELKAKQLKDMFKELFNMEISIAYNGSIFRNDIDGIYRIIIRDMKKIRSQYKNAMIRTDSLLEYLKNNLWKE